MRATPVSVGRRAPTASSQRPARTAINMGTRAKCVIITPTLNVFGLFASAKSEPVMRAETKAICASTAIPMMRTSVMRRACIDRHTPLRVFALNYAGASRDSNAVTVAFMIGILFRYAHSTSSRAHRCPAFLHPWLGRIRGQRHQARYQDHRIRRRDHQLEGSRSSLRRRSDEGAPYLLVLSGRKQVHRRGEGRQRIALHQPLLPPELRGAHEAGANLHLRPPEYP